MSTQQSLFISAPGLSDTDMKVLQVAIEMLNDEDINCSIIEGITGDGEIVVLDVDTVIGQAMYGELRDHQVKVLLSDNCSIAENNTISISKPVRVTTLKGLLHQICNQIFDYISARQPGNNEIGKRKCTVEC